MCLETPSPPQRAANINLNNFDASPPPHGVSCANAVTAVVQKDGKIITVTSIPVDAPTDSLLCFAVNSKHVKGFRPCGQLDCEVASLLNANVHPYKFVMYTEERDEQEEDEDMERPTYRGGDVDGTVPTIRPLEVFHNPDGGFLAVLAVSEFLNRTTTPEERAKLATPMLSCIKAGLKMAGIDAKRVFGAEYDEEDDSSTFWFLAFLFNAMAPNADIMLGVMAEGKTGGRFTFLHVAEANEEGVHTIPMLGLTHGDLKPMQKVDETHYLVTFDPGLRLVLPPDDPIDEEEAKDGSNVPTTLAPPSVATYCKDSFSETGLVLDVSALPFHNGPRGEHTHGNRLWADAQRAFQYQLSYRLLHILRDFLAESLSDNEFDLGVSPGDLRVLDMKGVSVPRHTMQAVCCR